MPRQNANRPANANYQDLLVDFTGWDFSQFDGQQEKPQEEPGFLSKLGNSAMAIGEGLTMLPGGVVDTLRDAYHGGNIDVTDADALRARQEREREQAEYARKYEGKTFDGVTDAMNSMGYTNPETGKADAVKGGTQIVFSSVGFGEQVAARRGFDLRGFMMRRFTEGGIPSSQVAWMGDYKTHAKKEAMFKDMRAGKVRVLIGSPQNMGTGVNVQKRLAKLHYLSPPWFPADVEQPHGRILRQGNQNSEVEINWYATKGTYDSTMWGMVARKARFIEQAFTGDDSVRTLEDISESSQYEMAAALAAGDERAIQLAGLNSDIERLSRLNRVHTEEQMRFRNRRRNIEHALEREAQERTKLQTALETLDGENVSADNFRLIIGKETYTKQKEAGEALLTAAERELARWTPRGAKARESIGIGSAQGKCPLILHLDVGETGGKIGKRLRSLEVQDFIRDEASAQGIATRLVNRLNGIERGIRESKTRESELRREQESLQRRIGTPFPQEEELNEKIAEAARIQAELEEEGKKQAETEQQTEEGEDAGGMASLAPGEYLPPRRDTRLRLRHATAQRVADALGKTAKNAAPVRVVQHFDELPVSIKKKHAGNAAALEGVFTFLPLLLIGKGVDPTIIGSFALGFSVGSFLGKMACGRFVDGFGPRKVFVAAELLLTALLCALIMADQLVLIVSIALLLGIVTKGTVPVIQAIITEPVRDAASYGDVFSINSFLRGITNMLTPLLFGFLASAWSMNAIYEIMAVAAAVAAVPVLLMRKLDPIR